jgi:hypothetical protein
LPAIGVFASFAIFGTLVIVMLASLVAMVLHDFFTFILPFFKKIESILVEKFIKNKESKIQEPTNNTEQEIITKDVLEKIAEIQKRQALVRRMASIIIITFLAIFLILCYLYDSTLSSTLSVAVKRYFHHITDSLPII